MVGIAFGWVGSAAAGTPPAVKDLVSRVDCWRPDGAGWKFTCGSSTSCGSYVKQAAEDGVADTLAVEVGFDTPDWTKGKRTVQELKAACKRATTSAAIYSWVGWFPMVRNDDYGDIAARCMTFYDTLLKDHGLPATTRLPHEGISYDDPATGSPFAGTLEEARKKFCDPKATKYLAAKGADEAPYRKALKADKLRIALANLGDQFYGPKRKELKTPADMAKAGVWFRHVWYSDRGCNRGVDIVHIVERYQFKGHALAKESSKNFCGKPPASAYK
jgi:hypothetical protein